MKALSQVAKRRRDIVKNIELAVYVIAILVAGCAVSVVIGPIVMF